MSPPLSLTFASAVQLVSHRPTLRNAAPRRLKRARVCCIASSSTRTLVDDLLRRVESHDGGPDTPPHIRDETNAAVMRLAALGDESGETFLYDDRLPSNYRVSYTSSKVCPGAPSKPVGGRFVNGLVRKAFPARGSFQHILAPDIFVNQIAFSLFGIVPGTVVLYGKLQADPAVGKDGIMVRFDRPRVRLGFVVFQFSEPSEVRLRVAYLDDRVRIGIGLKGSLFVLTKGGLADDPVADEWKEMFKDDVRLVPAVLIPLPLIFAIVALGVLCTKLLSFLAA